MGISRTKTGIKGLDELVDSGLPRGSTILLAGSPGTGKTIFGLQYLYKGASQFNEKGLYLTFEQSEESMKNQAKLFGWDIDKLLKKGSLQILNIPVKDIDQNTVKKIVKKVKEGNFRRLVIDSISTLAINTPIYTFLEASEMVDVSKGKSYFQSTITGDFVIKSFIYNFIDYLKTMKNCTTILISEAPEKSNYLSRDTVSEFVCDGVVKLFVDYAGEIPYGKLRVVKLRHTEIDRRDKFLWITKKGLVVKEEPQKF